MGLDDEGRGNPTSVISGSKRFVKATGSPSLAAQKRVYHASCTGQKVEREEPVNKALTILKSMKKSNKQSIFRRMGEGKS
jgi:hypothetical protein